MHDGFYQRQPVGPGMRKYGGNPYVLIMEEIAFVWLITIILLQNHAVEYVLKTGAAKHTKANEEKREDFAQFALLVFFISYKIKTQHTEDRQVI